MFWVEEISSVRTLRIIARENHLNSGTILSINLGFFVFETFLDSERIPKTDTSNEKSISKILLRLPHFRYLVSESKTNGS